jgi:hypothetical protein
MKESNKQFNKKSKKLKIFKITCKHSKSKLSIFNTFQEN